MTRPTCSISILADTRRRTATVAVALTALALLGAVAAGAATAQSGEPTVVASDARTAPDGTATVDVVLTSAPNGLSGYYLDLTVENPEVARIESAAYPDRFGLTSEPVVGSDGATVTLEAADMEGVIEPGATDVTLATVTVAGGGPGDVELTVEPRQFDADDGSAFTPVTQPGTVTVADDDAAPGNDGSTASGSNAAPGNDGSTDSGSDAAPENGGSTATGSNAAPSSSGIPYFTVLALVVIGLLAAVGFRRLA